MAEQTPSPVPENDLFPKDWRQQVKLYGGRKGFIRKELKRLGFWPPAPGSKYKHVTASEEAELEQLYNQLIALRGPLLEQLDAVDARIRDAKKQLGNVGNEAMLAKQIEDLIAEIRLKRIERVRQERAERKVRRAEAAAARKEQDKTWRAATLPHLGRGVSTGLNYADGDDDKLSAHGLPLLHTAQEVADALEITTGQLAWLTYHRGAAAIDHYQHFTIPKKSGGRRAISSPKAKLRGAQSWLLENVLAKVPVHEAAMAFRPKLNIAHNAARHAGASVIVRLDLKDFFPSITFRRVKRLFERLGFNEGVATLFALLATEAPRVELTLDGQKHFVAVTERFLPQGACTSPALTNILCQDLDVRLSGAARKMGFVYTRYADDLIFSARGDKAYPTALCELATKIITEEKFVVNEDKTAIMRQRGRQTVTGLVVNGQNTADEQGTPRVSRRDIRNFRAFLHQYELRGREAMSEKIGQDSLSYARGYLSFIHMASTTQATTIQQRHPWLERRAVVGAWPAMPAPGIVRRYATSR